MKLTDLFRFAIETGIEADPRTRKEIEAEIAREKARYEDMDCKVQERFDKDRLWNPYADSRVLYGSPDTEVKSVLWGIDITPAEILIADRLRDKKKRVDAVIGHHPRGLARPIFTEVMHVQEYMMEEFGVPITVAEDIMAPRIKEVQRAMNPLNYNQSVDACRLLDVPFMCIHSPTDNLAQRFVQGIMDRQAPTRVSDVLDLLAEIPEYDIAMSNNDYPEVYVGDRSRRAGKILVKMTGGTAGPKEMYEQLARAGVGTVVCMHVPDNHIEEAKKAHVNIVVAGHMASDSIGLNLMADRFEEKGIKITPFSGFYRVKRS
jgi:putative NIF3 family GTP cyclohydrolase 1 type 2